MFSEVTHLTCVTSCSKNSYILHVWHHVFRRPSSLILHIWHHVFRRPSSLILHVWYHVFRRPASLILHVWHHVFRTVTSCFQETGLTHFTCVTSCFQETRLTHFTCVTSCFQETRTFSCVYTKTDCRTWVSACTLSCMCFKFLNEIETKSFYHYYCGQNFLMIRLYEKLFNLLDSNWWIHG